jgi:hypothetical protein
MNKGTDLFITNDQNWYCKPTLWAGLFARAVLQMATGFRVNSEWEKGEKGTDLFIFHERSELVLQTDAMG